MTAEDEDGVAVRTPSEDLVRLGRKGRGASLLTRRIYGLALEAGDEGITAKQILEELEMDTSFLTDAKLWWQLKNIDSNGRSGPHSAGIESAPVEMVKARINSMAKHGNLKSLGHGGRRGSRYIAAEPPKGYRLKWLRQNPHGWYPVDDREIRARRDAHREMQRKRLWLDSARKELAKKTRSSKKAWELLEEAVRLIEPSSHSAPAHPEPAPLANSETSERL